MEHRLYRSRSERMIAGVCGGIAEYFAIDPTVVRMLAVVLGIVSFGTAIVAYIVMAIVVPEEPVGFVEGSRQPMTDQQNTYPGPDEGVTPAPVPQAAPQATMPPPPPPAPPYAGQAAGEPQPRRERRGGGIVFGILLVVLGLALLTSQLVPGLDLWRLWPLVIVVVGIRVMIRARRED